MSRRWIGSWAGGRIAAGRRGREVYILERMHLGVRYAIPLDVPEGERGKRAAELALAKFEADPVAFARERRAPEAKVAVDPDSVGAFDLFLEAQGRSERYRANVGHYLAEWGDRLRERDLRAVTTADLKAALRAWGTAERHRIIAIKTFASYLREEVCALPRASDPTLDLKVPPPRPEKMSRSKGYSMALVAEVYAHVDVQDVRDVLCLRAKTGMHETEVGRIAAGEGQIRDVKDGGAIAGTVRFVHKSGRIHVQSLDAQALAAARRIAVRGKAIDNKRQHREIAAAAERLTVERRRSDPKAEAVEPLAPGELRHSFVTWARTHGVEVRVASGGLPLARVAEAIGHQSTRTTARFYDGTEVPPMIALPGLVLVHADDPKG